MSKITIPAISSGYNAITDMNTRLQQIEDELNNRVLYRDNPVGESNTISNDIDMGTNDLINLGTLQAAEILVDGKDYKKELTDTRDDGLDQLDLKTVDGLNQLDVKTAASLISVQDQVDAEVAEVTALVEETQNLVADVESALVLGDTRYISYNYKSGSADGGELILTIPYRFESINRLIINGAVRTQGIAWDYDATAQTIELVEALEAGDEVVIEIGLNPERVIDNEVVSGNAEVPRTNGGGTLKLSDMAASSTLPVADSTALRLFEPTVEGQECKLSGHTVTGVGGGDFYAILNDTPGVDNNGTKFMTAGGHSWNRKSKSYSTPADFGCLGDGSDETVNLQAWIDNSTSLLAGTNPTESVTEYKYTHLEMDKENHHLTVIGDVRFVSISSGANTSFLLSGDFATIERGFFLGTSAGSKLETTGFSNYLDKVQVSGTHSEALSINGLETKVELGKYRGGTNAAILVEQPDAFLLGPYVEQARDGIKATGVGSINGYHVHAFGNTRHGFSLSGSSFSQLTSCYADTSGVNGYDFRDMVGGLTLTDCWSFKSGELVASSAQMQFFNCQNTKLIGCRMNTPGTAGTSESIRFSGSTNQVDLIGCYADQSTSSFKSPNTMTACTGELQKYSRSRATYLEGGSTVPASGSHGAVVKINTDTSFASPGFKAFDVRVTYRASSGGAMIGVEDHTVFIISGISGPGNVVTRFPASPLLTLSAPLLTDIGDNIAEFSITLSNADATRNFQYSIEVTERSTTRGYT